MTVYRGLRIITTDAGVIAADEHHVTGTATGDFVTSLAAGGSTVTTAAYAATVTPAAPASGDLVLNVGALTGNVTFADPTGTPVDGQTIRLRVIQDGTGSRTVGFGTAYAFGTDVTSAMVPTTASAKCELLFSWNATDSKWRALAIVRGF